MSLPVRPGSYRDLQLQLEQARRLLGEALKFIAMRGTANALTDNIKNFLESKSLGSTVEGEE